MYLLALKNFLRSRSVIAALVLFLVMGIISIIIGKQFLENQDKAVSSVTHFQKEHIERNAGYIKDEFGSLMYYLRFAYINKPDRIAALAIGQRDVNSSIQSLTIRGLEGQRYDTDLYNPYNLLTGNLDLSFIIIFLLPLLIIAFNFNVLSQEKEGGTWPMINVQSKYPLGFILRKLSIRFLVVAALLALLLLLAKWIIAIPLDERFLAFSITSLLYTLVWFAVSFLVIALKRNTSASALLLLSAWVLFCLLIPALTNNYITSKYTVPEAYSTMLKQRDGYHTKWDVNQDSSIQKFTRHYPQYSSFTWNKPSFNYMWYYAMQQLGDDEAREDSKAMYSKLQQRQAVSEKAGFLFPPMHTQLQLTHIAGSGMEQHLIFLDSTARFHENLRHYFYPKIFGSSAVAGEDWTKHVPAYFSTPLVINWGRMLLPLFSISLLLFALGVWKFKTGRVTG